MTKEKTHDESKQRDWKSDSCARYPCSNRMETTDQKKVSSTGILQKSKIPKKMVQSKNIIDEQRWVEVFCLRSELKNKKRIAVWSMQKTCKTLVRWTTDSNKKNCLESAVGPITNRIDHTHVFNKIWGWSEKIPLDCIVFFVCEKLWKFHTPCNTCIVLGERAFVQSYIV